MRRRFRFVALGLASLAVAAPAAAQTATDDVRCWIASNVFAQQEKDPGRKQVAVVSAYFYLGRLDGRITDAALKGQMVALAKTLQGQDLGKIMTDCAHRLQTREAAMRTIGQQLAASAPKPPAGAAPAAPLKK